MLRAVQVLMLLLVLGQAGGLYALLSGDACITVCEDDAEGQDCPPACPTCTCSLRGTSILAAPARVASVPQATTPATFSQPERRLVDPGPREIFHVPIVRLATVIS